MKFAPNVNKKMTEEKSQSPLPNKVEGVKKAITLSFPDAIEALIGGKKIRRIEWFDADEFCLLKDSFLMIHRGGKYHTWIVSEGDMLAIDWVVISQGN